MRTFRLVLTIVFPAILCANVFGVDASLVVESVCGQGLCVVSPVCNPSNCECSLSVPGEQCLECSRRGYIDPSNSHCVCYGGQFADPNNALAPCTSIIPDSGQLDVQIQISRSYCSPFCSRELGCFAEPQHAWYGYQPLNGIVSCANQAFGPSPGTIRESPQTLPPMTCNSYGAPYVAAGTRLVNTDYYQATDDTDAWAVCAGHGTWNRNTYRCDCNPGWGLNDPGSQYSGIDSERPMICGVCAPGFGPQPPDTIVGQTPCAGPYVPDPVSGRLATCGGHGTLQPNGACTCFNSTAVGFWTTATIPITAKQFVYTEPYGTAGISLTTTTSIEACIICKPGYGPAGDCTHKQP